MPGSRYPLLAVTVTCRCDSDSEPPGRYASEKFKGPEIWKASTRGGTPIRFMILGDSTVHAAAVMWPGQGGHGVLPVTLVRTPRPVAAGCDKLSSRKFKSVGSTETLSSRTRPLPGPAFISESITIAGPVRCSPAPRRCSEPRSRPSKPLANLKTIRVHTNTHSSTRCGGSTNNKEKRRPRQIVAKQPGLCRGFKLLRT